MIIDFIQQSIYSLIFFLGIAGVGLVILDILGFKKDNTIFSFATAYFLSLCVFVLFCVFGLFLFEDKLSFVRYFTFGYFALSAVVLFRKFDFKLSADFFKRKFFWLFLAALMGSLFLFFLQIYNTSILDEWLHRPVVKSFVQNGTFPLINPLSPDQEFIYTYHYGAHVIGAALELVFRLGISESLDLFKMANFIGAFLLFYGLLRRWSISVSWSLLSTIAILFAGSSFFLMDTFTTSHLKRIEPFGSEWPSNTPLSFVLSGITSVGVLLSLTFFFIFIALLHEWKKVKIVASILIGILFSGFMLLGEYYAILILAYVCIFSLILLLKQKTTFAVLGGTIMFALLSFIPAVYYSGGLGRAMLNSVTDNIDHIYEKKTQGLTTSVKDIEKLDIKESINEEGTASASVVMNENKPAFAIKKPSGWGYPSEKKIIGFFEKSGYYLRTFLLEGLLFVFVGWLLIRKKIIFESEEWSFAVFSLALVSVPFFITTAFGDLNLAKSLVVGFVLLHLLLIKILFHLKIKYKKYLAVLFVVLFLLGSLPGMVLGSNIQWRWISSKGKSQYCSQNPICYKEDITKFLSDFEKENPGLKRIITDDGSIAKVSDLTNAFVYVYNENAQGNLLDYASKIGAEYIIITPKLRGYVPLPYLQEIFDYYETIYIGEKYQIVRLEM